MRSSDETNGTGFDRRAFLRTAGAAGAASAVGVRFAGAEATGAPAPAVSAASAAPAAFELEELTVAELADGMKKGKWTSRRLVELYLARIEEVDRKGALGAVIETNPDALAIAESLDAERRAGKLRGPLHGIPVVVKDNVDSGDRMRTSAGSLALGESVAAKDAPLVARMRAAGAVLLGKTNLSEWANFRSTRSTSGWSARGGQTRNPYALDRNPCGSSSGTGAGIAANLAAVGVGTETDGSITCPSSMCGLVGLKPTVGLVSRTGVIPISPTQDTAGPMARTVADAALLLDALAGSDLLDPATASAPAEARSGDYASAAKPGRLDGLRIGVASNFSGFHPEIDRQFAGALDALRALGAEIVDPAEIPNVKELDDDEYQVLLYEFKHSLNAYLAALPGRGQPRTLAQLIAWNEANAAREMPWFGQEILHQAEAKGPLSEKAYLDALERNRRLSRAEGLDTVFGGRKLDVLVAPTTGPAYPTDWINGDHYAGAATTPSAVSGYPHVTVPAGAVHGLPWGLSILGPAWSERRLLRVAAAFEHEVRARRAPKFLAAVDFTA